MENRIEEIQKQISYWLKIDTGVNEMTPRCGFPTEAEAHIDYVRQLIANRIVLLAKERESILGNEVL